jgi:urease accessory protein
MRAAATIVAVADGTGGTRLATLYGEAPLLPRRTGTARAPVTVHLVGGAAGPLGGDRLRVDIEVGAGAWLCVRTVAATVALPDRDGTASHLDVCARVGAGGRLDWLPEPLVAAAGCHHRTVSTVDLAGTASLVWRDELVCGRHGEAPGDARQRTTVRRDGRTLYAHELTVGPHTPGWAGAAVLGGARAAGSVLVVDPSWIDGGKPDPAVLAKTAALLPLAGPAVLASATAADARELRAYLDTVTRYPAG